MATQKKASRTVSPAWLPDWRDPSQYPDPKKASGEQWAWEFLRRNPKYQQEYQLAKEAGDKKTWESLTESWGIGSAPLDPSADTWIVLAFIDTGVGPGKQKPVNMGPPVLNSLMVRELGSDEKTPLKESEVALVFDLALPLAPQLQRAKGHMLRKQRGSWGKRRGIVDSEKRARVDLYQIYLRLLDAEIKGASVTHMAKVLQTHNKVDPAHALKTVEHRGGLDAFLAKAKDIELSDKCRKIKSDIAKAKAAPAAAA